MRLRSIIALLIPALGVAMVAWVSAQSIPAIPGNINVGVPGGGGTVYAFPAATYPVSASISCSLGNVTVAGTMAVSNTVGIATPTYNVQSFPGATVPVSLTTPVSVATGTASFFANVAVSSAPTLGVSVQNTVPVAFATPIAMATGTASYFNNVVVSAAPTLNVLAFPGATAPVSVPTVGAAIQNTVAIATPTYNVLAFPGATVPVTIPTGNPCMNVGVAPVCKPLAVPSATTVVLVGSSGSQQIFGCSYSYSVAAGTSFQFIQASATASAICPTATVALTGAQAGGQAFGQFGTVTAGNKLCGVAAGAAVNAQGVFCYVQQ